jgi:serine/threonine protein kinase
MSHDPANINQSPPNDGQILSTHTRLAPGVQLGPYKIEALLGAGGMGKVYRALDTRLGRKVAIKISAEQFGGRFERERCDGQSVGETSP